MERFLLKPYWWGSIIELDSRNHVSLRFRISSTLVSDIGRYERGRVGWESGLRMGTIVACFHLGGENFVQEVGKVFYCG